MIRVQKVEERLEWSTWTTPKRLREKPIHRWFVFPHSYTSELVHALIREWRLGAQDTVLDPFAGAGTTILAAKECGVPAIGYDLSPLAVLAARTKVAPPSRRNVESAWARLEPVLEARFSRRTLAYSYPDLVSKALPNRTLAAFDWIRRQLDDNVRNGPARDFFLLALLSTIPPFSRAIATGGWLKWVSRRARADKVPELFAGKVAEMTADLQELTSEPKGRAKWRVFKADARGLPERNKRFSAIISSPPYPNRHDYTRVFGVELQFALLDTDATRRLRYQSFHSHPEGKPDRPDLNGYKHSYRLRAILENVRTEAEDPRIPAMLDGYFLDMYLCLSEAGRVCRPGARMAFVVGNAQYCGYPVPVDELTAEVGVKAGLRHERTIVVRYRGNSAQQMGQYGRRPSRESIVLFRVP